jgi:putative addiction module CopG family antidote
MPFIIQNAPICIYLPEPLKQFVEGQISTGRYSSASEYVRELIRSDEKRKAEDQLEALAQMKVKKNRR